jgi:hypothetical protein
VAGDAGAFDEQRPGSVVIAYRQLDLQGVSAAGLPGQVLPRLGPPLSLGIYLIFSPLSTDVPRPSGERIRPPEPPPRLLSR